jgi:hypothetical protein
MDIPHRSNVKLQVYSLYKEGTGGHIILTIIYASVLVL